MRNLTKNFLDDIDGALEQVDAIVGIMSRAGDPLERPYFHRQGNFFFSTKIENLNIRFFWERPDASETIEEVIEIRTSNSLSKVSNIKSSVDYTAKTLKISRIRLEFDDYIDINKRLSDVSPDFQVVEGLGSNVDINNSSWIGKDIYVWYKTPTTDQLTINKIYNAPAELDDNDAPLFFKGRITMQSTNGKTIKIQAEDHTQVAVGDKLVPQYSVSDIEEVDPSFYVGMLEDVKEQNPPIPMTYGKCIKANTISSYSVISQSEYSANYLVDWHRVGTTFYASNLPYDVNKGIYGISPPKLFARSGDVWVILNSSPSGEEEVDMSSYEYLPRYNLEGNFGEETDTLVPEFQEGGGGFKASAFQNRLVKGVYHNIAPDADITQIIDATEHNVDLQELDLNPEHINSHGGYQQRWFMQSDPIYEELLDNGCGVQLEKDYNEITKNISDYYDEFQTIPQYFGTWFFVELEEGCDEEMYEDIWDYDAGWKVHTQRMLGARVLSNIHHKCFDTSFATDDDGNPITNDDWNSYFATWQDYMMRMNWWGCLVKPKAWVTAMETFGPDAPGPDDDHPGPHPGNFVNSMVSNTTDRDEWWLPVNPTPSMHGHDTDPFDKDTQKKYGIWNVPLYHGEDRFFQSDGFWGYPTSDWFEGHYIEAYTQNQRMLGWNPGDTPGDFKYAAFWLHLGTYPALPSANGQVLKHLMKMKDMAVKHHVMIEDVRKYDIAGSLEGRYDVAFCQNQTYNWIVDGDDEGITDEEINELLSEVTDAQMITGDYNDQDFGVQDSYHLNNTWFNLQLFLDQPGEIDPDSVTAYRNWSFGYKRTAADDFENESEQLYHNCDSIYAMIFNTAFPDVWKGSSLGQDYMLEDGLVVKDQLDNHSMAYTVSQIFNSNANGNNPAGVNPHIPLYRNATFFRKVILPLHYMIQSLKIGGLIAMEIDAEVLEDYPIDHWTNWDMLWLYLEELGDNPDYVAQHEWKGIDGLLDAWHTGTDYDTVTYHPNMNKMFWSNLNMYFFNGFVDDTTLNHIGTWGDTPLDWFFNVYRGDRAEYAHSTFNEKMAAFPEFINGMMYRFFQMYYAFCPIGNQYDPNLDDFNHQPFGGLRVWEKLLPNWTSYLEQINADELEASMRYTYLANFTTILDPTLPPDEQNLEGLIEKPSDIAMHLLCSEMNYGRVNPGAKLVGSGTVDLTPQAFDYNGIVATRAAHPDWRMGFSISKKVKGGELLSEIMSETKSFPLFLQDGKFSFITIKNKYTNDDIDHTIDTKDIIKYKFKKSKTEKIITNMIIKYRHDSITDTYQYTSPKFHIEDFIDDYYGYDVYNITPDITFKEFESKYHVDAATVEKFAKYYLLNNCNTHNIVELELPLRWLKLQLGDIVHLPMIAGKAFGIDYSKLQYVSGQAVYPAWIVLETITSEKSVKIVAYQLHYLDSDGNHGWEEDEANIVGNMEAFNNEYVYTNNTAVRNYNYNEHATEGEGAIQVPYFSFVDPLDEITIHDWDFAMTIVFETMGSNSGSTEDLIRQGLITPAQYKRAKYKADGSLRNTHFNFDVNFFWDYFEFVEHNGTDW